MATFAPRPPAKPAARKRTDKPEPVGAICESRPAHEEIERRAYDKFLARGCCHGFHVQDWLDAEEELIAENRDRQ